MGNSGTTIVRIYIDSDGGVNYQLMDKGIKFSQPNLLWALESIKHQLISEYLEDPDMTEDMEPGEVDDVRKLLDE